MKTAYPRVALLFTVEEIADVFRKAGIEMSDADMSALMQKPGFMTRLTADMLTTWSLVPADLGEIFTDFIPQED